MDGIKYDVIIVGLSWVGLSTAYHCAKNGMSVLGFDMNSGPGCLGTSSFGETRLWRTTHSLKLHNDMMRESVSIFKEIEEETGTKLIEQYPVLTLGSTRRQKFLDIIEQFPDQKLLSPEEISEMFPGLENIPDDYLGILNEEWGIVRARKTLQTVKHLVETKYSARFKFNTKVAKVFKNSVETEDGATYTADHVVVAAGAYSGEVFDKESNSQRREIEYYWFNDNSGLPKGIIELPYEDFEFYGMVDGPDLLQYKMGTFEERKFTTMIEYMKTRMPSKFDKVQYVHPCFITMLDSEDFNYKTAKDGVHYGYGFNGLGFKFMPLHGKIIYEMLKNQELVPTKFRSKI